MRVQVFRGAGRVFAVTEGSALSELPERYGPWAPFKTVELVRGQPQPGLSVDDCLDDIAQFGIHATDGHVRITEQVIDERLRPQG